MEPEISIFGSISNIDAQDWDALTDHSPALSHAFLQTLEDAGCVGEGTGWQPYPVAIHRAGQLVGVMPLYLKGHSYGEYVFDWSWADAYAKYGMEYYPKLLTAIPFTPIAGPRLMSQDQEIQAVMVRLLEQQMRVHELSSAHVLFTDDVSSDVLERAGWMRRDGVQFRWENNGFESFDAFLSCLSHDKRKKIRQERSKVERAGVTCQRLQGESIRTGDWDFFFRCYENTYYEHRSTPYLNREFFELLSQRMPKKLLMIVAEKDGAPIASTLNLLGRDTLYGRYWGALEYIPGLHFELCYYQAQEFCIEQHIRYFEGGAQGEHKLARGFLPRATRSYHKLAHPKFDAAIREYVRRESNGMAQYHHELEERAPFKDIPI